MFLKSFSVDFSIPLDIKMTKNNYGKKYKNPFKSREIEIPNLLSRSQNIRVRNKSFLPYLNS